MTKFRRISTWQPSTGMHETVESMSSALCSVQISESEVDEGVLDTVVLRKKWSWKVVDGTLCVMGFARFWEKCPKVLRVQKQLCQLDARLVER